MNDEKYWSSRAEKRMEDAWKDADKHVITIRNTYDKAIERINEDIDRIFYKFANAPNMDKATALDLLNKTVSKKEIDNLKKIIATVEDERIKRTCINKLNSIAYKARITRLEALKQSIYINTKSIADVEIRENRKLYVNTYKEGYYKNFYEVQKDLGWYFDFARVSDQRIKEVLNNDWSGKNWSKRIWANNGITNDKIEQLVLEHITTGQSSRKMAQRLNEQVGVSKFEAERLIRTETSYIVNQADLDASKEMGVEKLKFVATLDSRTSKVCRNNDGELVDVDKAVPGKNIPPLHPFCRSITIKVLDTTFLKHKVRTARNDNTGKNYKVPDNTTYRQWEKEYVNNKH